MKKINLFVKGFEDLEYLKKLDKGTFVGLVPYKCAPGTSIDVLKFDGEEFDISDEKYNISKGELKTVLDFDNIEDRTDIAVSDPSGLLIAGAKLRINDGIYVIKDKETFDLYMCIGIAKFVKVKENVPSTNCKYSYLYYLPKEGENILNEEGNVEIHNDLVDLKTTNTRMEVDEDGQPTFYSNVDKEDYEKKNKDKKEDKSIDVNGKTYKYTNLTSNIISSSDRISNLEDYLKKFIEDATKIIDGQKEFNNKSVDNLVKFKSQISDIQVQLEAQTKVISNILDNCVFKSQITNIEEEFKTQKEFNNKTIKTLKSIFANNIVNLILFIILFILIILK